MLNQKLIRVMQSKAQKTYDYLAAIICLSIPFMTYAKAFVNIVMISMLIVTFFIFNLKKIKQLIYQKYFKIFFGFFMFCLTTSLINNSILDDFSEIRKIAQSLLLMILFVLVYNKEKLINALILGTIVSAIITCSNILAYQLNLTESLPLTGSLVNKLYITQRLYLGFLILISLIFLTEKFSRAKHKTYKIVIIFLSLLLFSALFIVSSRSSILIAFILFSISAFYMLNKSLRYLFIAFISLTFLLIILNNKTLSKRFLYSDDTTRETLLDKIKTHEPRYDIWKYSGQIFIEENPYILGIGTYKTQKLLSDKYKMIKIERRKNWFIERNFNTHNQYLDFAISFGITGLFIFLFFINNIVSNTLKNIYSLNLVTSLFLILLIENLFHRQLGSFLFSLIIILAIHLQNPKNEKNISS